MQTDTQSLRTMMLTTSSGPTSMGHKPPAPIPLSHFLHKSLLRPPLRSRLHLTSLLMFPRPLRNTPPAPCPISLPLGLIRPNLRASYHLSPRLPRPPPHRLIFRHCCLRPVSLTHPIPTLPDRCPSLTLFPRHLPPQVIAFRRMLVSFLVLPCLLHSDPHRTPLLPSSKLIVPSTIANV